MLNNTSRDAENMEKKLRRVQEAPSIRAGLKALGMSSLLDWYTDRDRILQKRSALVHPLCQPYCFLPGVRAKMFYDPASFPWASLLEARAGEISNELDRALEQRRGFQPYRTIETGEVISGPGQEDNEPPGWNMFYFYYLNLKMHSNCELCPITTEILESIPRFVRVTMSCFSALNPGTDLQPHFGPCNAVLRVHLGLRVPAGCGIRVGKEIAQWREGKMMIFSDAFNHQVWHSGSETRIVLFFDIYHPDWTEDDIPFLEEFLTDSEQGSVDFWNTMQELRVADASLLAGRRWWI